MSTPNSPTGHVKPTINPNDVAEAIESDIVTAEDLAKFEQKYNEHSVRGPVPKQVTSSVSGSWCVLTERLSERVRNRTADP